MRAEGRRRVRDGDRVDGGRGWSSPLRAAAPAGAGRAPRGSAGSDRSARPTPRRTLRSPSEAAADGETPTSREWVEGPGGSVTGSAPGTLDLPPFRHR